MPYLDPEKKRTADRARRLKYREKIKEDARKWYAANCEKAKENAKTWYVANRERVNETKRIWRKSDSPTAERYRIARRLRKRLHGALVASTKSGSAVRDLGCSIDYLRGYLTGQFVSGMTWENYGLRGWHIDHIKPLASFDLTKREEFLQAVHYTNLQPLWARDNLRKGKNTGQM